MAERPWHDEWIERDPNGPPPKRERGAPGSGSGWGWPLLGAGVVLTWMFDAVVERNRRWQVNMDERDFERRQQNTAWKHREDAATAGLLRGDASGAIRQAHGPDADLL